jgi:hypothetical protein
MDVGNMYTDLDRGDISGGVYDHITHFGYHLKKLYILKAWGGVAILIQPRENTV